MNKVTFVKYLMLIVLTFLTAQTTYSQQFAQFFEKNGTQDFVFTNNAGASGTFNTIVGGSAIDFRFQNIVGLHTTLTGIQDAHLTVLTTTTEPSFLNGANLLQPLNQATTIAIIRDTPAPVGRNTRTNLLTVTTSTNSDTPVLSGTTGGNSANFSVTTPNHVVTFSSDFLDFNNSNARNAALSFSSVIPNFSQGAGNFLANFSAAGSGTFASNPVPTAIASIGNRVWYDTNNNGIIDAVEVGISGISVSIFADTGCNNTPDGGALQTLTTDSNGYYRFDNLELGCYLIRVNPSNFDGGILEQYQNTTGNNTADAESFGASSNTENGVDPLSLVGTNPASKRLNGVWSNMLTLTAGGEPISEADVPSSGLYAGQGAADNQADMTVDFGFYELCLCGTLWNDNGAGGGGFDNGIQDGTETGIPAVRVNLYDGLGNPIPVGPDGVLGTADDGTNSVLTDASGVYHFRGLPPGDYRVASSNGTSSTPTTSDPNPNVDLDDNGGPTGSAIGAIPAGYIVTNPITLTPRGEPLFNDADGTTANVTLDLGFIAAPTLVKMSFIKAELVNGGVGLTWESGYESENLGYQVWREVNGERTLVNRDLVAGNALKTGTALTAGDTYRLLDKGVKDASTVTYFIEALDSKGQPEVFGPIAVEGGNERMSFQADSPLMADLSRGEMVENQTETVALKTVKSVKSARNVAQLSSFANHPKAVKLEVTQTGWYQVSATQLREMGLNPAFKDNWQMFVDGRQEAIYIDENSRGNVEFYGRGIDTNETRARVYWLVEGESIGKRINRAKSPFDPNANHSWNNYVAERSDKSFRASGILNGEMENWYSMSVTPSGSNQSFNLNSIATESGQMAKVSIDLQGATAGEHRVVVTLNGIELGTTTFPNMTRQTFTVDVPLNNLQEGLNTVHLKSVGAGFDVNFVEAMRITYPRRLVANGDKLSMTVGAGQSVKLEGFNSQTVRLFEVSESSNVSELWLEGEPQSDGKYSFSVPVQTESKEYLAIGSIRALQPTKVEANRVSDLKNKGQEANFIIIAPSEFHNSLNVLKAAREAEGLKTMVVDIVDIYDEFNGGQRSAKAVKDFLNYAKTNWKVKPDYVLFAGDASVDPKGYTAQGGAVSNKVPTMLIDTDYLETGSDESLVDFNNDGNGELSFGRLPVRNVAELNVVLNKILGTQALSSQEIGQRSVLFVTDSTADYDFSGATDRLSNLMPSGTNVQIVRRSDGDAATVRGQITNAINNGALMVNYFGHGTTAGWTSGNILRSQDATSLNNQRAVLMTMFTCLNGNYTELSNESIAEAMFKQATGGAFAVLASSGMNYADVQEVMNRNLYQLILGGRRLGDAAKDSKQSLGNLSHKRTWILFGDPTQTIVR